MARIGRPLMSMHAAPTPEHALTRWLLTCGVLLVSAFVLADEMARLETPPVYNEMLSDEIYDRAAGWREPQMAGDAWRAPRPEPKSRIRFGYDSTYEELRARDETRYSTKPISRGNVQPATQLKFGF